MRNDEIKDYLNHLYLSSKYESSMAHLRAILEQYSFRGIEAKDANTSIPKCLIIFTSGNFPRKSFKGFYITRVDFGRITGNQVLLAYDDFQEDVFVPLRANINSLEINVLDE